MSKRDSPAEYIFFVGWRDRSKQHRSILERFSLLAWRGFAYALLMLFLRFMFSVALLSAAHEADARIPVCEYVLEAVHPHDGEAFTQGLLFQNGYLYESTGLLGRSTVRKVRLKDGAVLVSSKLPPTLFGEGLAAWGDQLISITWKAGKGFRWDAETLNFLSTFDYKGEGWGLASTPDSIVMSDGTATLRFYNPATMSLRGSVQVTADGEPVKNLNELEWADGQILANVWLTDRIARIDPASGEVTAWIDLSRLVSHRRPDNPDHVLNGIAYDPATGSLFATGKGWLEMYQIRITSC